MTTHLAPEQFTAALDGGADAAITAHLASCASCRADVDALRAQWQELAEAGVPEPSPLFWDHFPSRVRAAAGEVTPEPMGGWGWRRLVWVSAAAAAVVLVLGLWLRAPADGIPVGRSPVVASNDATPDFDDVADLFDGLHPDDVAAFAPSGTVSWTLVDDMTLEEREAFVRLVERELEALP